MAAANFAARVDAARFAAEAEAAAEKAPAPGAPEDLPFDLPEIPAPPIPQEQDGEPAPHPGEAPTES